MAKGKKQEVVVIKDEETGGIAVTTEELKRWAIENSERTKQARRKKVEGYLEEGILLKENRDNKLWRHIGYRSFKEYVELDQHISQSYAYDHIGLIEKLPIQFVQLVGQIPLTMHKLTQLLPLPEKTLEKVDEKQLKEWAEMPLKDFNEEMRKTKARYQKVRRDKIRIEEKNLTLKAEIEELLKETEKLHREISILKTEEKNEKILKLQQDIDNKANKIKQLYEKIGEYEKEKYTEEQALAILSKASGDMLGALLEVQKIKVFPAILPHLWTFYKMADGLITSQIAYLVDEFDPESGPIALKHIIKDVPEFKGTIVDPSDNETPTASKPETETQ